jgi:hypothetical protein
MRTNFPQEIEEACKIRTDSAQFLNETEGRKMRFPKLIKHRRFEATIYGKTGNYEYYRVAYYVAGKRKIRNFKTFSEAKSEAERIVHDLAQGSQSAALSANRHWWLGRIAHGGTIELGLGGRVARARPH